MNAPTAARFRDEEGSTAAVAVLPSTTNSLTTHSATSRYSSGWARRGTPIGPAAADEAQPALRRGRKVLDAREPERGHVPCPQWSHVRAMNPMNAATGATKNAATTAPPPRTA